MARKIETVEGLQFTPWERYLLFLGIYVGAGCCLETLLPPQLELVKEVFRTRISADAYEALLKTGVPTDRVDPETFKEFESAREKIEEKLYS